MDRDYELQTHRVEDQHWWYRGRRIVLEDVIAGLGLPPRAHILDAGCGSGRNMVELARYGDVTGVVFSKSLSQDETAYAIPAATVEKDVAKTPTSGTQSTQGCLS